MRWTPNRKAEIIEEIQNRRVTPEEAMERHGLSQEELVAWMRDFVAHGRAGLRITKLQWYRTRRLSIISQANGHHLDEPRIAVSPSGVDPKAT